MESTGTQGYATDWSDDLEPLLTVTQCCELLQVSRQTVYRLINRGELVATRVGHHPRFAPADVRAFLARHRESDGDADASEMREAGFPASEPLADEQRRCEA